MLIQLLLASLMSNASAGLIAVPQSQHQVPVQGYLTDANGTAVDGSTQVTFSLYGSASSSTVVWTDTLTIDVDQGAFTAYLGSQAALPSSTFEDYATLHLGIAVESDPEMDRVRLGHSAYASWAEAAGNANLLDGYTAQDLMTSQSDVQSWSYDSESELTAVLDDNYLPTSWRPQWTDIQGRPAGLDDGDDTRSDADFTALATSVCYDSPQELTAALSGQYLPSTYQPDWSDIQNVPVQTGSLTEEDIEDLAVTAVRERGERTTLYQRDDDAPELIAESLQRFHMSLTAANYGGRTKAIPHDVFTSLCGDHDGCEVRLSMTRWVGESEPTMANFGSLLMSYHTPTGRWRVSNTQTTQQNPQLAVGQNFTDGDATTNHALSVWQTCYLTDGTYTGYANQGDNAVGFNLLVWNGYPNAARTCELTLID